MADVTPMQQKQAEGGLNPRVRCWLNSVGLSLDAIARTAEGEVARVKLEHGELMWTIYFTQWVDARWTEWAAELGFKARGYNRAHDRAMLAGHTHAEFDAWLVKYAFKAAGERLKAAVTSRRCWSCNTVDLGLTGHERPFWACAACWARVVEAHHAYDNRRAAVEPCSAVERQELLHNIHTAAKAFGFKRDWVVSRVELTGPARRFGIKAMVYSHRTIGANLARGDCFSWEVERTWVDNAGYEKRLVAEHLPLLGRTVVDPQNRHVLVVAVGADASGPYVETQLGGDYAATVRLPPTCVTLEAS